MKVAVVDTVASDLRWISKLFQIVNVTKLKAWREMLVGAKLLSGIYSKSVPDYLRLRERTNSWMYSDKYSSCQFNFVRKNILFEFEPM